MTLIGVHGPSNKLDATNWATPINPLPVKCSVCGFPDLDHVPEPYYLIRSRTNTSAEIVDASFGNLLMRDRARRVLESVAPGLCEFYPTYYKKSVEQTAWSLAVPVNRIATGIVKDNIPCCPSCAQPRSAHGSQYVMPENPGSHLLIEGDICKSKNWFSGVRGSRRINVGDIDKSKNWLSGVRLYDDWTAEDGIDVGLFLSVRLYKLFKALKIKGLHELTGIDPETKPSTEDKQWIAQQLVELAKLGIGSPEKTTIGGWFDRYVKAQKSKRPKMYDFDAVEAAHTVLLPPSYKQFMSSVGPKSYEDVDEEEGNEVSILPPDQMDFSSYRLGTFEANRDDEESAAVDGVIFASTGYGDCFVFDLAQPGPEYPVLQYLHEMNYHEHYAEDFMTCIKRFAGA